MTYKLFPAYVFFGVKQKLELRIWKIDYDNIEGAAGIAEMERNYQIIKNIITLALIRAHCTIAVYHF